MKPEENLSKLQIRAIVIDSISSLLSNRNNDQLIIDNIVENLNKIEDKSVLLSIFLNELLGCKIEKNKKVIIFLLLKIFNLDLIESNLYKYLKNNKLKDDLKIEVLNLLELLGENLNYNECVKYLEDSEKFIDKTTDQMLKSALNNPESKVDFVDFYSAISKDEKLLLINSFINDYSQDVLINVLSPIAFIEKDKEILEILINCFGTSKSVFAFEPLKYLQKVNQEDIYLNKLIVKNQKLLKISGVQEDQIKYRNNTQLFDSIIQRALITYPDGQGNIGIFVSRKKADCQIQMFAVVLNDIDGIVSSFGFNSISPSEYRKLVEKFNCGEYKLEVENTFIKDLLNDYENLNIKNKKVLPYEYICWKYLLMDIPLNEGLDFNGFLLNQYVKTEITYDEYKRLIESDIFDLWFVDKYFKKDFEVLVDNIYNTENLGLYKESLFEVFDDEFIKTLKKRMLIVAYLLKVDKKEEIGQEVYNLAVDAEGKYFNMFLEHMIKTSIYQDFLLKKQNIRDRRRTINVFIRKNKEEEKYDLNRIDALIRKMEELWS